MSDLAAFFKEGRLGDNLPRLILANVDQIPAEIHAKIDEMNRESTAGWFDTHPASGDRIAAARREGSPGIFRLEYPATLLFADFDTLARQVTEDYYRAALGPEFDPATLHPVASLLARQAREQEAVKAARRYFQAHLSYARPLSLDLPVGGPPASVGAAAAVVKSARQRMLDAEPGYRHAREALDKVESDAIDAEMAAALLRAGAAPRADQFRLPLQTADQVGRVREQVAREQISLQRQLEPFETAARQRLAAALQLACVPKVAARIAAAKDIARIVPALELVAGQSAKMLALRNALAGLAGLIDLLQAGRKDQTFLKAVLDQMGQVHACLSEIHKALAAVAYPFEHAKGLCSLAEYALPSLPSPQDLEATFQVTGEVLQTLGGLYLRMMGELVLVAEKVETMLGLPPLPDPPEEPAT